MLKDSYTTETCQKDNGKIQSQIESLFLSLKNCRDSFDQLGDQLEPVRQPCVKEKATENEEEVREDGCPIWLRLVDLRIVIQSFNDQIRSISHEIEL